MGRDRGRCTRRARHQRARAGPAGPAGADACGLLRSGHSGLPGCGLRREIGGRGGGRILCRSAAFGPMSAAPGRFQASTPVPENEWLAPRTAVWVFMAFALAYFLSALVRAVTATLSPVLSAELALQASDLGLLAGGYFFGFALTQMPLGTWLDRYGPRRVILAFLCVAVLGCAAFAMATSFAGLLAARVLTGMGVSACLMAPLTGYRRWLSPATQMRANSWMLMTGSFGMVASTLPVQWLLPLLGWRWCPCWASPRSCRPGVTTGAPVRPLRAGPLAMARSGVTRISARWCPSDS